MTTTTACTLCGTQTLPGTACVQCGTPVPATMPTPEASGHDAYWQSILAKLQAAMAPKYQVLGLLGYGGMAGVFLADEVRLGRKVAVKVMSPALMMDAKLVERFIQEARTIALLTHPNIITIHEIDGRDDLHWFTMSYVSGRTLGQVMSDIEPLSIPVVRAWLYQIGDGLSYAHRAGVVHRDVKPGNVLLDQRGNALVTDFGIAKVADGEAGLTRTNMLVGTPTYMSPEQCTTGHVTGASDQYSLGVLVYQMLTGYVPFSGPPVAVLQAHVAQEPQPVQELRPDCPDRLAEAVHRMLAKRPEDRWPTIAGAIAAATAEPPGFDDPIRMRIEQLAAPATTVLVSAPPGARREGSRTPLDIAVYDAAGNTLTGRRIEWHYSRAAVVAVIDDELFALSPGSIELTAMCGGTGTTISIEVEPDPIGDIRMDVTDASVVAGEQQNLLATVHDLDGSVLDDRAVLWSSSDPNVAHVATDGSITGIAPGQAVVTAHSGGKFAAATINVSANPEASLSPFDVARRTTTRLARTAAASQPTAPQAAVREATPAQTETVGAAAATTSKLRLWLPLAAGLLIVAVGAGIVLSGDDTSSLDTASNDAPAVAPTSVNDNAEPDPAAQNATAPGTSAPSQPVANAQDSATTAPPPTTRATSPAQQPQQQQQQQSAVTTPVVVDGSIAVSGSLPAGASVTARDASGRVRTLGSTPVALEPGSYTVEFSAPGYETESRTLVVRAGEAQTWAPTLRAVPPPRDDRADQAAIATVVRDYVSAFNNRDAARVVPLMPSDLRAGWSSLLQNRDVTDFSATIADLVDARVEGDAATLQFTLNVSFRLQNQTNRPSYRFTGTMQRAGQGWRLVSLTTTR